MRIPIGAAVAGLFGVVPATVAIVNLTARRRFAAKIAATRVAILGRSQVGKTALLRILEKPSADNTLAATADTLGGAFEMSIAGKPVTFEVPRDLRGDDGLSLQPWKDAFDTAGHVWYLFRADLVAAGDSKEIARIRKHLDSIAAWMSSGHRPKVVLIGTWADASDDWSNDPSAFERSIASADPIKVAQVKLNFAALIVGSLSSAKEAKALVRSLRKQYR